MTLAEAKAAARAAAKKRRAEAYGRTDPNPALEALESVIREEPGAVVAGYMAIGTELDPAPLLNRLSKAHSLCLPVTHGRGRPLTFHAWTPGELLGDAGFGTRAPVAARELTPEIVIVPLLAFDRCGGRMGYGAGHYDRTLADLRSRGHVRAIGLAHAAQEADLLPQEPTDQRLDMIVTERGIIRTG